MSTLILRVREPQDGWFQFHSKHQAGTVFGSQGCNVKTHIK